MPSAKYALSASPLMLSNGSTAIDGFAVPAAGIVPACTGDGAGTADGAATPAGDGRSSQAAPAATTMPATIAIGSAARLGARRGTAATVAVARASGAASGARSANARTDSAMFLTLCAPRSRYAAATRFLTAPRTASETTTPPGVASACSRAAMLTPSP